MIFHAICMKCQILFSGKNKKNIINLSSAENAQRVVKVNLDHMKKKVLSVCALAQLGYMHRLIGAFAVRL